jgi:hypothetical protein
MFKQMVGLNIATTGILKGKKSYNISLQIHITEFVTHEFLVVSSIY